MADDGRRASNPPRKSAMSFFCGVITGNIGIRYTANGV
jgi:hypothetical protein